MSDTTPHDTEIDLPEDRWEDDAPIAASADDGPAHRDAVTTAWADDEPAHADAYPEEDDDAWDDVPAPTARAAPSRRRRAVPLVLGAIAVAAAGFVGGVQVQKGQDDGGSGFPGGRGGAMAALAGGMPGGTPGGPGAAGGDGAAPGAGASSDGGSGTTVGTVKNAKGSKLYVETSDGTTVEVRVGSQAKVQRLSHSSVGGVHPGDTVIVEGEAASSGAVRATRVQATAPNLTALGLGRGAGGAARVPGGSGGASASGGSGSGTSGSASRGSGDASSGSGSSGSDASGDDVDRLFGD
ncbi:MAG: hypothetical protein M0P31_10230 [Solirubrobacteraceae bacterium]|nr:hypothetical protein [Solirubrobacteraceae bacterium]